VPEVTRKRRFNTAEGVSGDEEDEGKDKKRGRTSGAGDTDGDDAFRELVSSIGSRNKDKTKIELESLEMARRREERELRVLESQESRAQREETRQAQQDKRAERERNLELVKSLVTSENETVRDKAQDVLLAFLDAQMQTL
jgi:sirohydrochlorin ferrochelatase